MAIILKNGEPKLGSFKAGDPVEYSITVPVRSFVQAKTSTSDSSSANSTMTLEGVSKTHRAQINLLSTVLSSGEHTLTVSSDKDARFAVSFVAVAQSRLEAFKSFFRG